MTPRTYTFHYVETCEMCGSSVVSAKRLGLRPDSSIGFRARKSDGIAVSVFRCSDCDFVFANPEPRPAALTDHYNIPPEDYWSNAFLEETAQIDEHIYDEAKRLLNFQPGMKALDVGTGVGTGVVALQRAGFDAWAIEPSPTFHARALEFTGLAADRIALASVADAEFPAASFDLVSFSAVLEHFYDPSLILEKAMTWLKPGGILYAEIPSADHLIVALQSGIFKLMGTTYTSHLSPMHKPFHVHEFTLRTFQKHAARLGTYEVAAHRHYVCSIEPAPRLLHPLLRAYMERTRTGMQLIVHLRRI